MLRVKWPHDLKMIYKKNGIIKNAIKSRSTFTDDNSNRDEIFSKVYNGQISLNCLIAITRIMFWKIWAAFNSNNIVPTRRHSGSKMIIWNNFAFIYFLFANKRNKEKGKYVKILAVNVKDSDQHLCPFWFFRQWPRSYIELLKDRRFLQINETEDCSL